MGRRARVSREQVLDAARRVFARRGFEGATLTAIAAQVGVSPAALRHAPTKDALFAAAMAPVAGDFELPMDALAGVPGDADPRPVLRRLALEFVPFLESRIGPTVVSWLRRQAAAPGSTARPEPLALFDTAGPNPPQRALVLLTGYFRRAAR